MDKNFEIAKEIAKRVQTVGGKAYFVGGYVRDAIMGIDSKDIDIEVHCVSPKQLEGILNSLGECRTVGVSFGVYGLAHYDIDIAMPRIESKSGRGHRDFDVFVDPFLGTKKAAMRRDFTINAMMQDVLSGEIIDHFGGREDLRNGVIRHVNDASFAEDPLRVLRAAQFAARFGFSVADETMELCSKMDLTALAKERIMGELQKALLKAEKPSVFFETLKKMGQLERWFPEIGALIGVEQEFAFHPEGDVFNHTMLVLDEAAKLRDKAKNPTAFMLSALCHDLGKPEATKVIEGRIRAFGHEELGVPLARKMINRLTSEAELKKYVANMVLLHMRPNSLFHMKSGRKAYMRLLSKSICPEDLLLLAKADHCGRTVPDNDYSKIESTLAGELAAYRELMSKPQVGGEDLIKAGMKPGKGLGAALEYARKLHLSGVEKEKALAQTMAYVKEKNLM